MNLSHFNRKGQMDSYIAVVVFLFVFGFLSFLAVLLLNRFISAFQAAGYYDAAASLVGSNFMAALRLLDYIIVFVLVALIIGIGLTSYRLNAAPAFFVISVLMASFLGFIGYFFSYAFIQIVSQPVFSAITYAFPITILVCSNLHWVALVVFIIGSITLYAKKEEGRFING